jgi:heme/copper-type cytochrome/quinol oxidase subunit 3
VLFLISEVMLFGGFFWSYFDRVFNPGAIPGCHLPTGLERIDYWRWPLIGTIVLVTSGYFANHAYYSLRGGSRSGFYLCGSITLLLGILFLCIQLLEYNGLDIRISDNVYGSFFFLLTGFHGFHVTVGILFLFDQYFRLIGRRRVFALDRSRHIGVACALIYWHFVDVIWIFLFINVYVLNNTHFGDWMDTYFDYESAVMPVISFLECNDAEIFFLTECCGNMIYQEYPNY